MKFCAHCRSCGELIAGPRAVRLRVSDEREAVIACPSCGGDAYPLLVAEQPAAANAPAPAAAPHRRTVDLPLAS